MDGHIMQEPTIEMSPIRNALKKLTPEYLSKEIEINQPLGKRLLAADQETVDFQCCSTVSEKMIDNQYQAT